MSSRKERGESKSEMFMEEAEKYIESELLPMFVELIEEGKELIREIAVWHGIHKADEDLDNIEICWIVNTLCMKATERLTK